MSFPGGPSKASVVLFWMVAMLLAQPCQAQAMELPAEDAPVDALPLPPDAQLPPPLETPPREAPPFLPPPPMETQAPPRAHKPRARLVDGPVPRVVAWSAAVSGAGVAVAAAGALAGAVAGLGLSWAASQTVTRADLPPALSAVGVMAVVFGVPASMLVLGTLSYVVAHAVLPWLLPLGGMRFVQAFVLADVLVHAVVVVPVLLVCVVGAGLVAAVLRMLVSGYPTNIPGSGAPAAAWFGGAAFIALTGMVLLPAWVLAQTVPATWAGVGTQVWNGEVP